MNGIKDIYLIGAEHSLYTAKLRSYLRYKEVKHTMVTATKKVVTEFIIPTFGWAVMPVVIVDFKDGKQRTLQDTGRTFWLFCFTICRIGL